MFDGGEHAPCSTEKHRGDDDEGHGVHEGHDDGRPSHGQCCQDEEDAAAFQFVGQSAGHRSCDHGDHGEYDGEDEHPRVRIADTDVIAQVVEEVEQCGVLGGVHDKARQENSPVIAVSRQGQFLSLTVTAEDDGPELCLFVHG